MSRDSFANLEAAEVVETFPVATMVPAVSPQHESGAVGPHRQLLSISRSRRQIPRCCGSESVQVQVRIRCGRLAINYRAEGAGLLTRSTCEYGLAGGTLFLVRAESRPR